MSWRGQQILRDKASTRGEAARLSLFIRNAGPEINLGLFEPLFDIYKAPSLTRSLFSLSFLMNFGSRLPRGMPIPVVGRNEVVSQQVSLVFLLMTKTNVDAKIIAKPTDRPAFQKQNAVAYITTITSAAIIFTFDWGVFWGDLFSSIRQLLPYYYIYLDGWRRLAHARDIRHGGGLNIKLDDEYGLRQNKQTDSWVERRLIHRCHLDRTTFYSPTTTVV